jgi:hypothetical protein
VTAFKNSALSSRKNMNPTNDFQTLRGYRRAEKGKLSISYPRNRLHTNVDALHPHLSFSSATSVA